MLQVGEGNDEAGKQRIISRPPRTQPHKHIHTEHASGVRWGGTGEPRRGKGAGEFVIVIARRGRAAIAITPRRRSYRRVGLLASATRTYLPTYVRIRRHRRRHFARPTHIFAPLGDAAFRKALWREI